MSLTPRSTLTAIALGAVLMAGLAACSSPSSDSAAPSGGGAGARYGACMREAGFQIEDPSDEELSKGGLKIPESANRDDFQAASARCGGPEHADAAQTDVWAKQMAGFVSCLAEHGVDVSEEDLKQAELGAFSDEHIDTESPAYKKALPLCQKEHLKDWGTM